VVHDDVVPLLQLRITLEDVEPGIWRLLEIGGDRTLSELHDALQIAVGWTDSHLHLFEHLDGRRWSDPTVDDETDEEDERTVRLDEVLGAAGLRYEYDFGDSWSHRIELIASTDGGRVTGLAARRGQERTARGLRRGDWICPAACRPGGPER
jgi:hypothetical protein